MKWWLLLGLFGLLGCVPTEASNGSQAKLLEIIERLDRERRDQQRATAEAKSREELRSELKREIDGEFQSRFIPLERNLAALVDRMESLEASRQKGVDDETRTLADLKKAARELGAEVASLSEALSGEREGRTTLERKLTKLEDRMRSQPAEIQRLVEASFDAKLDDKLASRLGQSDKRLAALSELVGQSQTKLDASFTALGKQVADLGKDKADAARIDKLSGDIAELEKQVDGYAKGSSTATEGVTAKLDGLAGSITALQAKLAKGGADSELRGEIEKLLTTQAGTLSELGKQLAAAKTSRETFAKKLGAVETALADMRKDLAANPTGNPDVAKRLDALATKLGAVETALAEMRKTPAASPSGDPAVSKRLDALEKRLTLDNARREQEVKDLALRIDALGATLSQGLETIRKQAAGSAAKPKVPGTAQNHTDSPAAKAGDTAKGAQPDSRLGEAAFWEDPFLLAAGVALLVLFAYLLFRRDEEDEAEAQSEAEWEASVHDLAEAVGEEEPEPKHSSPEQTRAAMEQARLLAAAIEAHTQGLGELDAKTLSAAFEPPAAEPHSEPHPQQAEPEPPRQRPDPRRGPVTRELSQPAPRPRNGEPAPQVQSLRVASREAASGGDEAVRSLLSADPRVLVEPAPRVEWRSDGALSIRFYLHGAVGGREAEDLVHACRELAVRE